MRLVPAEPRGRVRGREQSGRVAGLSPGELLTDTENELRLGDMAGERKQERK